MRWSPFFLVYSPLRADRSSPRKIRINRRARRPPRWFLGAIGKSIESRFAFLSLSIVPSSPVSLLLAEQSVFVTYLFVFVGLFYQEIIVISKEDCKFMYIIFFFFFQEVCVEDIEVEGLGDKLVIIDSVPRTKYIKLERAIGCCDYYYFVFYDV